MRRIKNIPVVMMMENTECGAACLNMILGYYGKWVSLEQVRQDCAINRDGSNALNLVLAARNYGLVGGGYRASVDALKDGAELSELIERGLAHELQYAVRSVLRGHLKSATHMSGDEFTRVLSCGFISLLVLALVE